MQPIVTRARGDKAAVGGYLSAAAAPPVPLGVAVLAPPAEEVSVAVVTALGWRVGAVIPEGPLRTTVVGALGAEPPVPALALACGGGVLSAGCISMTQLDANKTTVIDPKILAEAFTGDLKARS